MIRLAAPASTRRVLASSERRSVGILLALAASIALPAIVCAQGQPVTFSVAGDYPYGDDELVDLQDDVDKLNLYSPSKFFVHVGDIFHEACLEYRYTQVADALLFCQIPAFIVPGDNEWGDCDDPDQGWQYWQDNFLEFDDNFCKTWNVDRQTGRTENWSFITDGVLFLGVSLPNQEGDGAADRTLAAANWLVDRLSVHGSEVRAVVIFGQAWMGGTRDTFVDQLETSAISYGKPMLYAMGDEHNWLMENPFPAAPNVTRIVVERGHSEDPVQVTVTMDPLAPWDVLRDPWSGNPPVVVREPCGGGGIVISDASVPEPDSGTDPAAFVISVVGGDGRQVTADWQTSPGTATPNVDYVPKSGTVTLSGTTPSRTIIVSVKGDTQWEPDETFLVDLSNATNGARIVDPQGIGTILNDDPLPYHNLTLATFGQGTIQLDPPGTVHAHNSVVTATAVYDSGWTFDGWTGALAGKANPDSFVVVSDTVLVAAFSENASPLAVPEAYSMDEDDSLVVAAPGLLENDVDPDLDYPLSAVAATPPPNGTVLISPDGSFAYSPAPDFFGADSFVYYAVDARGALDSATVTIDIAPVQDAPVGSPDAYTTDADQLLEVGPPGVLLNDADPDGDPFSASVATPPTNGTLSFFPDGSFSYDPLPGFVGVDTFTYRPADAYGTGEEVPVTVSVGATSTWTFAALDDGYVASDSPDGNHGSEAGLRVRGGSPSFTSYVQFVVDGMTGVTGAKLRLLVTNSSTDGGEVFATSSYYRNTTTLWDEDGLNASNAPTISGSPLFDLASVGAGDTVEVDVSSAVGSSGNFTFALKKSSANSAWYSTHEGVLAPQLVVTGFGPSPDLTIAPPSQDWGDVLLGEAANGVFEIRNDGGANLVVAAVEIEGVDASAWSLVFGGEPGTLAPGESRFVELRFEPGSLGPKSAVLSVLSDSRNEARVDAALAGRAVLPDIDSDPAVDFGDLLLGLTAQTVLGIRNVGTSPLGVDSLALVGPDSSEFSIPAGAGFVVAPGDSLPVQLGFLPTTLGPKSATLRVWSDDPDESPLDVSVAGTAVEPDIAVDPAAHDFGDVVLGAPVASSFVVSNAGTAPLSVGASTVVGPDSTEFAITAGAAPFSLAAGESMAVEVTFAPASLDPKSATLRLESDDPDEAAVDVPLAGRGVQPDVRIEPVAADWGDVLVGSPSSRVFAVFNDGTSDLHVASSTTVGADSTEFAVTVNAGALTIAPGDSAAVEVTFTPGSLGPKASAIRVSSDDPDEADVDVPVSGVGVQPDIVVEPSSHDYGPARLTETIGHQFLVWNAGTAPLSVTATGLAGADSADFVVGAGAAPFTLAPGESSTVDVSFRPSAIGPRSTALRFESDDPDEAPLDVPLSGLGIDPEIVVEPSSFDWGNVRLTETIPQLFAIVNEGTADLAVSGVTLEGPDAGEFDLVEVLPFVLAPGDSFWAEVSFHPSGLGPRSAFLRVANDDLDEGPVLDVPLAGTGSEPEIAVTPASADWGGLRLWETESRTFVVRNEGTEELAVSSATLEGPEAADFALLSGAAPFVLAPGDSLAIEVSFHPSSLGPKSAALRLASDDLDENPLDVPLAGEGVEPDIELDPVEVDWGDVVVGTSAPRAVLVRNTGTHELAVETTVLIGVDPGEFSIVAGSAPFVLAAGDSAVVDVDFHPSSVGAKAAGLRVTSDDPDEPMLFVSLSGNGVSPEIAVDPLAHHWGIVRTVEAISSEFVVRNEGSSDLAVTATELLGPDAADFAVVAGAAPFTVAPGGSLTVEVAFQPSAPGPRTATLRLASDDLDEPVVDIALSGDGIEPDVVVVPTAWDFGGVRLGQTADRTFMVLNSGAVDLVVTNAIVVGGSAAEFGVTAGGGPFVVAPGDSSPVVVQFHPSRVGPKIAALRISTDDVDEGMLEVPLTAAGVEPEITVEPASHDYGSARLAQAVPATFTVRNDGSADLAISATTVEGTDAAEFALTAGGGAVVLAPGDSASVEVTFTPSSLGAKSASLRIANDDLDEGPFLDVALTATGVEPDIAVEPTARDWGEVLVDSVASGLFVVRNEGTFDLSVTSTTFEGPDATEFTLLAGGAPFVLAPGDSATVEVGLAPIAPGPKAATLRLESDDLDEGTLDVALSGTAVSPEISVEPPAYEWGDLRLAEAVGIGFVVGNGGTAPLHVTATTVGGTDPVDFAVTAGAAPFTVAPGESATVEVTFAPSALGPRSATLSIASDDPDAGLVDVALGGSGVEPDVAVDPAAHDFGGLRLDAFAEQTFVVTNAGTFPLAVAATTLEGPDAGEFSIESGAAPFVLEPGATAPVVVRFDPASLGPKSAALRVASDDADEPTLDVPLAGAGVVPDLVLSPTSADWGEAVVGQGSARAFTARNDGTDSLFVSGTSLAGPDAAEFAVTAGAAPFALAPGESLTVEVTLTPAAPGPKSATLSVASDDPGEPLVDLPLVAIGVEPDLVVSPASHDWGELLVGTSAARTFSITNEGSSVLHVSGTSLEGVDAAEFAVTAGAAPFELAPGESILVEVTVAPVTAGPKSATLAVASDDLAEPVVPLGLAAVGVTPEISVSPASHDWGGVLLPESATQEFRVVNEGSSDLHGEAPVIAGPEAAEFSIPAGVAPFVLAAGETLVVEVLFDPVTLGTKSATLSFASDDLDEPVVDVPLAGAGVEPDVAVAPASHDFGDVVLGTVASRTFSVVNEGTAALAVTATTFEGPDAAELLVTAGAAPFTLAPGESASVEVAFAPVGLGPKSALLRVTSDDPDEGVLDVPLTGRGVAPDIAADADSLDWGTVVVGESPARTVVVRNEGTSALAGSASLEGPDAAEFAIAAGTALFSLAPGESIAVDVLFAPVTTGPKQATLRLASDDPDEPVVDVALAAVGVAPDIALTPTAEDWGAVLLGDAVPRSFTIRNDGSWDLAVSAATLEGADAADFSITAGAAPFTVAPGESAAIEVTFLAASTGLKTAALRIASDDPDEGLAEAVLAATAVAPDIEVLPSSHDFGPTFVGATVGRTLQVLNAGTSDLHLGAATLSGPEAADFAIAAGGSTVTIAPGDTVEVDVTFTPSALGVRTAALVLPSDDPDESPFDVSLSGTGVLSDIAVFPSAHDWGDLLVGSDSAATFVVANEGASALTIDGISIEGEAAVDFAVDSVAVPFALAAGESLAIAVHALPTTTGPRSATLRFASDDPDENPLDVPLSLNGVSPEVEADPAASDWGGVVVGDSVPRVFLVRNAGTATLHVASTAVTGPHAADFAVSAGGGPFEVLPGDSASVEVGFAPTAAGARTAVLEIASDDLDEPVLPVALDGTGWTPDIAVTPTALDWGGRRLSEVATLAVSVVNDGTSPLHVDAPALAGPDAADFAVAGGAVPFTLAPGETLSVALDFQPGALGARTATLRLTSDDLDESPLDVPLAGEGVEPDLAVDPAAADFGPALLGEVVARSFTVSNAGTHPLTGAAPELVGADAADFSLPGGATPWVLAPGESLAIDVAFAPASLGAKAATLRLASDDPDEPVVDLPLSGAGVEPDVAVEPSAHDWGDVRMDGLVSAPFVTRNEGSADLHVGASIVGPDAADWTIVAGAGPSTIAPGDSAIVEVDFGPLALGPRSAALRLTSDDPDEPVVDVPLTGNGLPAIAPDITLVPTGWDWGSVPAGTTVPTELGVRNDGDDVLSVTSLLLGGPDATDFSVESGGGAFVVAPGETHALGVSFHPAGIGARSATLTIESDDADEPSVAFALAGTGVEPVVGTDVEFVETQVGGSGSGTVVSVEVAGGGPDLYLAAVATKPRRDVVDVSGLGIVWTRVAQQCGGRGQTGVEVWAAYGTGVGGPVTATLASGATSVLNVSRYAGADPASPLGAVVTGNTNGPAGACSGGTDGVSYALTTATGTAAARVYSAASMRATTHVPGAGFTERAEFVEGVGGNAAGIAIQDKLVPSAGPTLVDGTFDKSVDWATIGLEIRGAPVAGPIIAADAASHDFGPVVAGSGSAAHGFTIRNDGNEDLHVTAAYAVGADAADFAITGGGAPFTLAPAATQVVDVTFAPVSGGAKNATLRFSSDDAAHNPFDLALAGVGSGPEIAVAPASVDFGAVRRLSTESRPVVVRNEGTSDLHVSSTGLEGPDAADFAIAAGAAPLTIAAGDSATILVELTPASLGPLSASLALACDDADEASVGVPLAGEGVEPDVALEPATLDWGVVPIGLAPARTIVVTNTGTAPLAVAATGLGGPDAADFSVTSGAAPFTVAPGDSHAIEVVFAPATTGSRAAVLTVASDDPDEPTVDVALAGEGTPSPLSADPAAHDYGGVPVGVPSPQSFVLRNGGPADVAILGATLEGPDASDFGVTAGGGPLTLAPGDSTTWEVTFLASTPGSKAALLRVANDGGPLDVPLSGLGLGPDVDAAPSAHDFGELLVGDSATVVIAVSNQGTTDLAIATTGVVGADSSEFSVLTGGGAATLAPGDTLAVEVAFHPALLGAKVAALRVDSDDPDESPLDVPLTGTGVPPAAPRIAVEPATWDFGIVAIGAGRSSAFEVRNDGDADLHVTSTALGGPDAAELAIESGGGAFTLAPAATRTVVVSFQPSTPGPKIAALSIASDDTGSPLFDVALSGTATEPADIAFEASATGGSAGSVTVTSGPLGGVDGELYLAAIAAKPQRNVAAVDGLGLVWTRLDAQCAGRSQTGLEVWMARGAAVAGAVTATFTSAPTNAAISVTRYSGVDPADPIGDSVSANTNGEDGACSGGSDTNTYSVGLTVGSAGAWTWGAASMRDRTHEPGTSYTERADFVQGNGGGAVGIAVEDRAAGASGPAVVDGSFNSTVDWAVVALELRPGAAPNVPDLEVDPPAHAFGEVVAGTGSAVRTFTLRSAGSQPLAISSTTIGGPDAGEFAISAGGGAALLAPGDSMLVEVTFSPLSIGPKSASLVVASDDPDENPLAVALIGDGVASLTPEVTLTPASQDWGSVAIASSATRTFSVRNDGTAPLEVAGATVLGLDAAEFTIVAGGGPVTLAPGAAADVDVRFEPASAGAKIATLRVTSDDPDEPFVDAALSGEGVDVPAGGDIALEQTRTGGSSGQVDVASAALDAGLPGDFHLAAITTKPGRAVTAVTGLGLAWTRVEAQCGARGQTGIEVWRAQGAGSRGAVVATFASAPTSAAIVVTRYSGVDPATPLDDAVSANTLGVDGACTGGTDTAAYSLGVTTVAGGSRLWGATSMRQDTHEPGTGFVERADFVQGSGGDAVGIAVEDALALQVGAAVVGGSFAGTVDWAAVGLVLRPATPVTGPAIAGLPAAFDFGTVFTGSASAAHPFTLWNTGTASLSVAGAALVGPDAVEFQIVVGGEPASIAPGDSARIDVVFTPATEGAKSATLRVTSDDPDDPVVDVALSGLGAAPPVPGGEIVFEDVVAGASSGIDIVETGAPVVGATGHLYLASIAAKPHAAVTGVSGLGLVWSPVATQCGGRGQTDVEVWSAIGTPASDESVIATFETTCYNAAILVARYSGVHATAPLGASVSGNTLGPDGACSGGVDGSAYSFDLTTSVDGAVVFAAASMRTKSHQPGAGWVEQAEVHQGIDGNAASVAVMDRTVEPAATVTVDGTFSGNVDWAVIAVEILPGAPPAGSARRPDGGVATADHGPAAGATPGVSAFEITRLWPNPFRDGVTVEYVLPSVSNVTASVYDAGGRLVRSLHAGPQGAGVRELRWDARDTSGQRVGPGVYFLRISGDHGGFTRKLVLRR